MASSYVYVNAWQALFFKELHSVCCFQFSIDFFMCLLKCTISKSFILPLHILLSLLCVRALVSFYLFDFEKCPVACNILCLNQHRQYTRLFLTIREPLMYMYSHNTHWIDTENEGYIFSYPLQCFILLKALKLNISLWSPFYHFPWAVISSTLTIRARWIITEQWKTSFAAIYDTYI